MEIIVLVGTMRSHNLSWPIEVKQLWSNCAIILPPHYAGHLYLYPFQCHCKPVDDLFNPQSKIVCFEWSHTNYGHETDDLMPMVCVCLILPSSSSFTSFYIYILADFMTLASKISTQADGSDIVKEEDPASIVASQRTVFISWFSGNLNVCIPGGGAVPVSSLSLGLLLCLKVLYVSNTVYERTTQSVYGVLERLAGIPGSVTLGTEANRIKNNIMGKKRTKKTNWVNK